LSLITRIEQFFKQHPLVVRVIRWLQTHSFPGLQRIPIYNLLVFIEKETHEDAIVTRANSMAFSLFLAMFPAVIVLFTLLPYTPLYSMKISSDDGITTTFEQILRSNITEAMPGEAGQMLVQSIDNLVKIPRGGLLSFGFILAIWFASNGMLSMMRGLEKDYQNVFKKRSGWAKRLISIQLTFLIGLVLVSSVVFVILGNTILSFIFHYIEADLLTRLTFFAFKWIVVLAVFYTTFSTIYRYGSSTRRRIHFFNPGAMLATLLSILTSWGFSYYVDNFGSYNKVYGSIGALIVLMIWIQLNCMILLIGFELNAGIAVLREEQHRFRKKA
jgi:membrane protein